MSLLHGVGDFFALDIGTNALRVVQLTGDARHGWALTHFAYMPADPKILQDDSEAGIDKKTGIILEAVKQAGVKTKNVAVGLPAGRTYTAIIEVPNAPKKSIENSVKYSADQYVPMQIDQAEFDYAVLGVSPNDETKAEVLISSTAKAYAEARMNLLEMAGFNVVAQEPEPIAMARALVPIGNKEAQMVIDLGEKSTDLVVMYQGVPRLVRTIPGGLMQLVRTVTSTLSVREDQARQFILKFGLAQDKLDGQVFKAMEPGLEAFAAELTKSVRFFQTRYQNAQVQQIVLSGFAGVIPFIAEYMEAKTSVQTVQGNPWQRVQVNNDQQQALAEVASEFAVAIGLAERVND